MRQRQRKRCCCISFDSYIKPQQPGIMSIINVVVYLLIPTSNHNHVHLCARGKLLYIFWFLHQTTTWRTKSKRTTCCISFDSYIKPQRRVRCHLLRVSCISFDSYIKPQLLGHSDRFCGRCISFDSYIKPQLWGQNPREWLVVYLLIPTSNHNLMLKQKRFYFVVYLLIPTSNHNSVEYVKIVRLLYIFWFLHQTTTWGCSNYALPCCISFDSYIKPQPVRNENDDVVVVYLLIPTSNHNSALNLNEAQLLYIFWFLHQTTTWSCSDNALSCCISFDSYIKPQPITSK